MKKLTAIFGLLALAAFAYAGLARAQATLSKELLVLTTATVVPRTAGTNSVEIQNLGPSPIFCAFGAAANAVVGKARRIDANGGSWVADVGPTVKIWCVCSVNQLTGAATVVNEAKQ